MNFDGLKERLGYLPPQKLALVEKAYQFAAKAHIGQWRISGDPYIEHPLQTAVILAELQLDASSIAAALLHDVTEDGGVTIEEMRNQFDPEIASLVDGTSKLSRISWESTQGNLPRQKDPDAARAQAENLRKMLLAMAVDLRVVFIKLADRLHNMRTLAPLPPEKRRSIAQETLEIYAPLAHRLGIWDMKWQLEDLAFRYLHPQRYREIAHLVVIRRQEREQFVARVSSLLQDELKKAGIRAEVSGRPKHIYSIYQKTERYAAQGKHFSDIHDLFALRVLVDSVADCYFTLGVIHNLWHPLPGEFDDYIANPKENGYQGLHTTVMSLEANPLEVQIRTHEMHRFSEYGVAAHWRYKEGTKPDMHYEDKIAWLRQLVEWQRELSGAEEFLESVKTDIFIDQVFVFTPKGEIRDLPKGATPLDFAYRIHTDLGHRCIGSKVNGRLVSLNYQLQNGDTVEILTTKTERGPSRDWLNPNLGFINTSQAREKIRQWFKKRERTENVQQGQELLEKELRRLGISLVNQEKIARLFKYDNLEDFYAALGYGDISVKQIAQKLPAQEESPKPAAPAALPALKAPPSSIQVLGVGDLLTHMAHCCNPLPGDDIIGYITRSRGVTIHRSSCSNIAHQDERERLIDVRWGNSEQLYPVLVKVEAWDRVGLLRDISTVVAEDKVNIGAVTLNHGEDNTVVIHLSMETKDMAQLSRLLHRIEGVRGVTGAARSMEAVAWRSS